MVAVAAAVVVVAVEEGGERGGVREGGKFNHSRTMEEGKKREDEVPQSQDSKCVLYHNDKSVKLWVCLIFWNPDVRYGRRKLVEVVRGGGASNYTHEWVRTP